MVSAAPAGRATRRFVSYGGGKRYRRTAAGIEESDLVGAELATALVEELEMSEEIVAGLVLAS